MPRNLTSFAKPTVVISKCLGFGRCRYDQECIASPFVKALKRWVKFIPVCPEMEIGLGVPRDKVILVQKPNNKIALYQPATKRDLTRTMTTYTRDFLNDLDSECDGFILKRKSPSCGIKSAKLYESTRPDARMIGRDTGLFAAGVLERFPHSAITDEEQLEHARLREHWLTKLFVLASFRAVQKSHNVKKLIGFHQYNHTLFLSHNATHTHRMDALFKNRTAGEWNRILPEYESLLHHILSKPIRTGSAVKVLREAFEHFKPHLSKSERTSFVCQLRSYESRQIPLSAVIKTVQVWGVRYEKTYLRSHSFFRPFPWELAGHNHASTSSA